MDDKKEYVLVNITEEVVRQEVKNQMQYFDMCKCEKCYLDTCAIALNHLKAQYVTTQHGALLASIPNFLHLGSQMNYKVEIMIALNRVKDSPQHED